MKTSRSADRKLERGRLMAKKAQTMMTKSQIFKALGLKAKMKGASFGGEWFANSGEYIVPVSPTTGEVLAKIEQANAKDYNLVMKNARNAFSIFQEMPAPLRGEIVRQVGEALRAKKDMQIGRASCRERV